MWDISLSKIGLLSGLLGSLAEDWGIFQAGVWVTSALARIAIHERRKVAGFPDPL